MERLYKLADSFVDRVSGIDKLKPEVLQAVDELSRIGLPTTCNIVTEAVKSLNPDMGHVQPLAIEIALERLEENGVLRSEEIHQPGKERNQYVYRRAPLEKQI